MPAAGRDHWLCGPMGAAGSIPTSASTAGQVVITAGSGSTVASHHAAGFSRTGEGPGGLGISRWGTT